MSGIPARTALSSIGIRVEGSPRVEPVGEPDVHTMNVLPLLHEVRHALQRLLTSGEATTIDLGSMPLAPGELEKIDDALGVGEVRILLESLGPSQLYETRYAGVWRVTHRNAAEEVVGRYLEIARVPAVLPAQEPDMSRAFAELTLQLQDTTSN